MKLSNKLLIGLSLLVYIVPLSAYISEKINNVDAKDFYGSLDQESKSFAAAKKYLKAVKVEPFKNIKIVGNNDLINLHLIQDDSYGIKTVESTQYEAKVNIQIKSIFYSSNQVYIYAPNFSEISLNSVNLDQFVTKQDSLHLNIIEGTNLCVLYNNESLKSATLNFTNSKVNLKLGRELQNLNLQLKDSEIVSDLSSFNNFSLKAENSVYKMTQPQNVKIEEGSYFGLFNRLSIQTQGKSNIWIPENFKIDHIEGNLSQKAY
jgi:hypothetical protein